MMTEAEWLACTQSGPMLGFLGSKATQRKLRLFGVACCRLNWDTLTDQRLRDAVEIAEHFADGRVDENRRSAAEIGVMDALEEEYDGELDYIFTLARDVLSLVATRPYLSVDAIRCSLSTAHWALIGNAEAGYQEFGCDVEADHIEILRDIFGNPFRPVTVDPAWRTSTVLVFARQVYESRDFSVMPILADALQDAGCDYPEILDHCRGPGPHVRGCWVVDLVLAKEKSQAIVLVE